MSSFRPLPLLFVVIGLAWGAASAARADEPKLRCGIIGLDTSHATAFTKLLNAADNPADLAGCRVVAAYPKGSPDIESSVSRVPGYTEEVKKQGVEIVDSIEALLERVDVVLLETNDGRPHLEQVLPVLRAKKRVFIDKPVAGSLADAVAIYELSKKYGTPLFSSSSLRYVSSAQAARRGEQGQVLGALTYSPSPLEATHPDLYWYGIHGVETLFTVMGPGCESIVRTHSEGTDVVTGAWSGGRVGTFRGIRQGKSGYGGVVFTEKEIVTLGSYEGYRPLLVEIVKFFRGGDTPIDPRETLELYAFMEAADVSKREGGRVVKLSEVFATAEAAARERLKALGE